ncbi:hypothetical protein CAOG_02164 [Capsaspora owczarzaki ATCC 30864]|uniref:WD40 repeat-containing protein SMU1 n=1 Tax=Capsaspora owczarzaki (strain ATCC 30864) TaxID=595528 RepID=A0A0D2X1J9_CAPO3|nr:hypothetical protein CAOG_02164 [Capsaspora owczarzaki ATCC 30864]KJE90939.1 hypothetical protein CAOG_002164 [Capsaspora owczarzaki ATCC 30864]|eukprot:XP_004348914.1 hypothetical protein CAOG_02164 [Capsaspora owczarzaki ATCC 30864]
MFTAPIIAPIVVAGTTSSAAAPGTDATTSSSAAATSATSATSAAAAAAASASDPISASIDIEATDVIRLVQQFLKENGLTRTLATLQDETSVTLNTVDNLETFVSDVINGHWDSVLNAVQQLQLPDKKLIDLHEQIYIELVEMHETGAAKSLLKQGEPLLLLKKHQPHRYQHLEGLLAPRAYWDPQEVYLDGSSKEKRRTMIAHALAAEIHVVPAGRLLSLIGQAVKWQYHQGLIQPGASFDLFRGRKVQHAIEEEQLPTQLGASIKFGKQSHPECAKFSPDGQYLATGSVDHFVELWNPHTGKIAQDLRYQAKDDFMLMESTVLCLGFSVDSEMLATGAQDGKLKIWRVQTGEVLRRFEKAHNGGLTSVKFSRDNSQVLTTSFDQTIKLHGLKSGKTLKEFRGHVSFVNDAIITHDGQFVISGSSDGTVKVWDMRTTECTTTVRPHSGVANREIAVTAILPIPRNTEQFLIVSKSNALHVINLNGLVVRTLQSSTIACDFVAASISPRGEFVYAVGENRRLYAFRLDTGELEGNEMELHEKEVIGIEHHPHLNIVATFSEQGPLKLWKP